jgi:hypothetical protein
MELPMRVLTTVLLMFIFVKPAEAALDHKYCEWLKNTAEDETRSAYEMFDLAVEHHMKAKNGINPEINNFASDKAYQDMKLSMASAADLATVFSSLCKD